MKKDQTVPVFHTHQLKAQYLQSQSNLILAAAQTNIRKARGAAAARKFMSRLANDLEFAKQVVDMA